MRMSMASISRRFLNGAGRFDRSARLWPAYPTDMKRSLAIYLLLAFVLMPLVQPQEKTRVESDLLGKKSSSKEI